MAILVNPDTPLGEAERKDAEVASRAIGQRLDVLTARNEREIAAAFAALKQRRIGARTVTPCRRSAHCGTTELTDLFLTSSTCRSRPHGNFCPHLSTYASSDWTGDA